MALVNEELSGGLFYDLIRMDYRKALKFDRFDKNPTLVVNHEQDVEGIIGHVTQRTFTDEGLKTAFKLAPTPRAESIGMLWDEGYIKGLSIWFAPTAGQYEYNYDKERNLDILDIYEAQLLNLSIVGTPRDPDSLKSSYQAICNSLKDGRTVHAAPDHSKLIKALTEGV